MSWRYIQWLIKYHAMNTCWGSGGMDPPVHHLGSRWRWVVRFTLLSIYSRGRTPGTHWMGGSVGPRAFSKHNIRNKDMVRVEVFTATKIRVLLHCTPWSVVVGYQHFRGRCCLHLQHDFILQGVTTPETLTLSFLRNSRALLDLTPPPPRLWELIKPQDHMP
jgi:hypothetical protein